MKVTVKWCESVISRQEQQSLAKISWQLLGMISWCIRLGGTQGRRKGRGGNQGVREKRENILVESTFRHQVRLSSLKFDFLMKMKVQNIGDHSKCRTTIDRTIQIIDWKVIYDKGSSTSSNAWIYYSSCVSLGVSFPWGIRLLNVLWNTIARTDIDHQRRIYPLTPAWLNFQILL